jgi:hypothetical protein
VARSAAEISDQKKRADDGDGDCENGVGHESLSHRSAHHIAQHFSLRVVAEQQRAIGCGHCVYLLNESVEFGEAGANTGSFVNPC